MLVVVISRMVVGVVVSCRGRKKKRPAKEALQLINAEGVSRTRFLKQWEQEKCGRGGVEYMYSYS